MTDMQSLLTMLRSVLDEYSPARSAEFPVLRDAIEDSAKMHIEECIYCLSALSGSAHARNRYYDGQIAKITRVRPGARKYTRTIVNVRVSNVLHILVPVGAGMYQKQWIGTFEFRGTIWMMKALTQPASAKTLPNNEFGGPQRIWHNIQEKTV